MAEAKGKTAVPAAAHGDHDRVQMLSLKADGTPDQSPGVELIGDREVALDQTREQFRQQAVSAVDQAKRAELGIGDVVPQDVQDPAIAELQAAHQDAEKAATSAADATVGALFKGDDTDPKPVPPVKSDIK